MSLRRSHIQTEPVRLLSCGQNQTVAMTCSGRLVFSSRGFQQAQSPYGGVEAYGSMRKSVSGLAVTDQVPAIVVIDAAAVPAGVVQVCLSLMPSIE